METLTYTQKHDLEQMAQQIQDMITTVVNDDNLPNRSQLLSELQTAFYTVGRSLGKFR